MSYFTKSKWVVVVFIVLVTFNIATLAAFWLVRRHPGPPPGAQGGVLEYLSKELGFDSVQKEKYKELAHDHQRKVQEIRRNNREAKDAFFALLQQPDVTDSVIEKAAKESGKHDAETDILTFHHFQEVRKLCNDDQKKKFDAIIQQVLRMNMQGGPQGPPPQGREGRPPEGPPPGEDGRRPPPPQQ